MNQDLSKYTIQDLELMMRYLHPRFRFTFIKYFGFQPNERLIREIYQEKVIERDLLGKEERVEQTVSIKEHISRTIDGNEPITLLGT
jgi:uncharacterized protein (UPF0305 family)